MENNDREQENMHWLAILMLLCNYDNNLYSAFADSVILENRYMPTDSATQFFEQFKSFSKQATGYIPKGKTLYRARAIDESYNSKFMNELVETIADEDFHEESKAFSSPTMSMNMSHQIEQ